MRKNITLGICGAIGSTNMYDYFIFLSRKFNINVVMTDNSKRFISKDVVGYYVDSVYSSFDDAPSNVLHADIANKSDLIIIMPATANIISKLAYGIADDLLTTVVLIYNKPILIAPNMNINMWNNKIIQNNVSLLKSYGHKFINKNRLSYAVCDKEFVESDCALPTIKELLEEIECYFKIEKGEDFKSV